MPGPFPFDIWSLITRYAVTRNWDTKRFNPPPGDFDCVKGFAETSRVFEEMVQSLKDETLSIYLPRLSKREVDDATGQQVRHLHIRAEGGLEFIHSFLTYQHQYIEDISNFSRITSLSINPHCLPLVFLSELQTLPVSCMLQSIDISGQWELEPGAFPDTILSFPNLKRLRLSHEPWRSPVSIKEDLVDKLALFFGGCLSLGLFSIHAKLDDEHLLEQQGAEHMSSIEHLQPSEGYERDMADCPLCFASYDHSYVIRKENAMTRVLALQLPNLSEVRWANTWIRSPEDEYGQRATKIRREHGSIVLQRDDGQSE